MTSTVALPESVDAPVIVHGNCIEVMRGMAAESVHVIITDPPAGIGFMDAEWDSFADYRPHTVAGRNALRMLTSLASSDATLRALTAAVKQARADVRAAAAGEAKRTATAVAKSLARVLADAREALRVESGDLLDFAGIEPWAAGFVAFLTDVWTEARRVLRPGGQVCAWALPKTADLAGLALRLAGFDTRDSLLHLFGTGMSHGQDISKAIDKAAGAEREVIGQKVYADGTKGAWRGGNNVYASDQWTASQTGETPKVATAPATPEAAAWADWNTQLAPAAEYWLIGRAPSPLNYAATAVEFGTGALNIGATRVPRGERAGRVRGDVSTDQVYGVGHSTSGIAAGTTDLDGYPSNVLISHSPGCGDRCVEGCPALELDRQSGTLHPSGQAKQGKPHYNGAATTSGPWCAGGFKSPPAHSDSGGASRFFPTFRYQAKAKRRDIPGRSDLTITHETHKHPDLMRWLVRLLASPGAVVLDPFSGSGTTGVACVAEGFRFIGIELNPASVEQARARLAAAVGSPTAAIAANTVAPMGAQLGLL